MSPLAPLARGLVAGLGLSAVFLGADARPAPCTSIDCPPCGPTYCTDVEAARAEKARKKGAAVARGLPERLAKMFDDLPDCVGCVRISPDWPHIVVELDPEGWERSEGRPPPYTSHSQPWTRAEEKWARDMMRKGLVKSFRITLARFPCRCCPPVAEDRADWTPVSEDYWSGQPGWNEDLNLHESVVVEGHTSADDLGPDPADLTNIAEADRRPPVDLAICGQAAVPPAREVHVSCEACRPFKEEHDRYSRWIHDARVRIASYRRSVCILNQVVAGIWRESQAVDALADTPETAARQDALMEELSTRLEAIETDEGKIRELEASIAGMEASRQAALAKLAQCEATQCRPPEEVAAVTDGPVDPAPAGPAADDCTSAGCDDLAVCAGPACDVSNAATWTATPAGRLTVTAGGLASAPANGNAADHWTRLTSIPGFIVAGDEGTPTHVALGADGGVPVDVGAAISAGAFDPAAATGSFALPGAGGLGAGSRFWVGIVPTAPAGGFKIADDESPRPRDRFFLHYDYFQNAPTACPGIPGDVRVLGFEKTFMDGAAGVELRLPFQAVRPAPLADGECGDLSIVLKSLLSEGGGGIALPRPGEFEWSASIGGPIVGAGTRFLPGYVLAGFVPDAREEEPSDGSYDVAEAFAELRLPLLRDTPFFHRLELNPGFQDFGAEVKATVPGTAATPGAPGGGGSFLDEEPWIHVESLGGSTGEVLRMTIVNPTAETLVLDGYAALEPVALTPEQAADVAARVRAAPGARATVNASAYCLDIAKRAPPAGVVFRLGDAAKQRALAPLAEVLDAAERVRDAGLLAPDTDPAAYFHSIRQWALWTVRERFDRDGFVDAFVEHTKVNFAERGGVWTDEVEATVRGSAGTRWQAIQAVLAEAER